MFPKGKGFRSEALQTLIPPTKRPSARTDKSKPNCMDVYGLRPLKHPWRLLSPYEFVRQWTVEPFMTPSYYSGRDLGVRSGWTSSGEEMIHSSLYKQRKALVRAGEHYERSPKKMQNTGPYFQSQVLYLKTSDTCWFW